jgi:hypothetical protein
MEWTSGEWAAVAAGDYVLGKDGYVWLVKAMVSDGGDTQVWIARPERSFSFELRPAAPVQYHRPQGNPQGVRDAVAALTAAGFEVTVLAQ